MEREIQVTDRTRDYRGSSPIGVNRLHEPRSLGSVLFGPTRNILHQFARYVMVGGLAFVIDFGSLYLFTELARLYYLVSAAVAFMLGLVTNYSLSRLWVFDRRTLSSSYMEFLVFALIGVVGLGWNEVIIWFVVEKVHLHYLVAKLVSVGIVMFWNFGARKLVLFR